MALACEGLKVLDFGQGYGAIPGMILADYGAEVIKVEPPQGEMYRSMPAFLQWNRGKKGVVLDLKTEEGRKVAQALAARSDVVIENFRPGVAERLGIGYGELSQANPSLVYLAISGFGQKGKYRNYKAYEGIVAAKTGQDVIQNGYRSDGPIYDAIFKCSYGASILGLIGVLSAVHLKDKTGAGQKVESTMVQANFVYSYSGIKADDPSLTARLSTVQGRDPHNVGPGYRISQCKDGKWIQSGSAGDYLLSLIDAAYKTKTLDEWMRIFNEYDAAYGTFMTTQEFMDYPQVVHNGHVIEVDDPQVGKMKQIGQLAKFGGQQWKPPAPAPRLGQHTQEVLQSLTTPAERTPSAKTTGLPEGALNDVTILDLSTWAAAPGGPGILADLGARVIKLEPLEGDPLGAAVVGELFFRVNRGKERVAADLKTEEGREILHKLAAKADVVVHNFRPGVEGRLGLSYETLRQINPRLVYIYATSFGSSGEDAQRPAFDALISAMAGGEVLQAGEGNGPQQRQTTDHSAMLGVAVATLLGLRARDMTGQSQYVETTMLCSAAYLLSDDFLRYEGKPPRPVPDKGQYGLGPLYRLYRAKEGWVFLAVLTEGEWSAFCDAVGRTDLKADPRFATKEARAANREALAAVLEPLFQERTAPEWEGLLQARDVACAVADGTWPDFLFNDWDGGNEQARTTFTYPGMGRIHETGNNVDLRKTPGRVGVCQTLGASTQAVLTELGYTAEGIEDMKQRKVITWAEV